MLNDRQYKYWLTRNCARDCCWVVGARLGEMISHPDTKFFDQKGKKLDKISLTHQSLEYIYFAVFDNDRLITLVEDPTGFYLIENTKEVLTDGKNGEDGNDGDNGNGNGKNSKKEDDRDDEEDEEDEINIASVIRFSPTLDGILGTMTTGKRKQLGLKKRDKAKLKPRDTTALKGVVHIDLINQPMEKKQSLWNTFIKQCDDTLDLSGFHTLPLSIVENGIGSRKIATIILYQNINLYSFAWIKKFPRANLLSIWMINMVDDKSLESLVGNCTQLETVEIHNCYQVTGRALITLSKLVMLSKILIDNEQLSCQENPFSTVIKREEWQQIENNSSPLELLLLNSSNLTLDYIDFVLGSFKHLKKFVMNTIILEKLYKNSYSGSEKEEVIFQSFNDPSRGYIRKRDVRVYGLLCSQVDDNVFSDSMLNKIAEQNPDKAEIAELLRKDNCS
jgi:hypothetical protein